jgi:hypothetical protein
MRVSLSRWTIVGALLIGMSLCGTGCRAPGGAGWGWSTPTWLSWSNWGWGNNSSAAALAQTKPSTTVPKPSSLVTPQATSSVAATPGPMGYPGATNPNYAASAYPATARSYGSPYGTQPAAAYQQPGVPGQVQPTVGYQTGPYGMTSGGAGGYGAGGYAQGGYPAGSGATWNQPAAGGYGAAGQPAAGGYQTADQRSVYGAQESSPYSNSQSGYSAGGYSQPSSGNASYGATNGTGAPSYGAGAPYGSSPAPAATTSPWNGYQGSSTQQAAPANPAPGGYSPPASTASASAPGGYGQPAAPTASAPASGYPGIPASLATDSSSYKPGSTAGGYGVQSAGYTQPQTAYPGSSYNPSGLNYGNTYTR